MNDRQAIEALFFPLLFKSVVKSSSVETDGNAKCVEYLDAGMREVLDQFEDRKKAARRPRSGGGCCASTMLF